MKGTILVDESPAEAAAMTGKTPHGVITSVEAINAGGKWRLVICVDGGTVK